MGAKVKGQGHKVTPDENTVSNFSVIYHFVISQIWLVSSTWQGDDLI